MVCGYSLWVILNSKIFLNSGFKNSGPLNFKKLILFERERETELDLICWFTHQMHSTARVGPGQSQVQDTQSRSLLLVEGTQVPKPLLTASQDVYLQGIEIHSPAGTGTQTLCYGMQVSQVMS